MRIVPTPIVSGLESNFGHFEKAFPDTTARHETSLKLAAHKDVEVGSQSQTLIAAHWGHTDTELKEVARFVYGLGLGASEHKGMPVVVLTEGSVDDILSDRHYLEGEISGSIGIVPNEHEHRGIFHGFGGRVKPQQTPGYRGVVAPYIIAQSHIHVDRGSVFAFEGDEFASAITAVPEPEPNEQAMLLAYEAVLPLMEDGYYQRMQVTDFTVIYGLRKVREINEALVKKGFNSILEPIEDRLPKVSTKAQKKADRKKIVAAAMAARATDEASTEIETEPAPEPGIKGITGSLLPQRLRVLIGME